MPDEYLDNHLEEDSFYIATPELLNELISEDYPHIRLGPSVSQVLTSLTNGFLEDVVRNSYIISRQQNHCEIQSEDILIYLKMKYAGTGLEEFCEFQSTRKDLKSTNHSYLAEPNSFSVTSGLLSLKKFNIERLKKAADLKKKLSRFK